jgi:iron complex transport system substrate-binding protein
MAAVSLHTANGSEAKEILFIRAGSQYSATKAKRAPDHFACIMLDQLGSHNVADDAAILLDGLSLEEILLRDPDYIFLTTMGNEDAAKAYIGDLFLQEGWSSLTAVQKGCYTFLPKDLFHFKPNARWAEAYGVLAQTLYPELNIHD